jgi:hypothetical protein
MPFPLQLDQQGYEALIALARKGAETPDEQRRLDAFLVALEKKSGISRYGLWVQWQEQDQPLPPTARFPEKWPPEMRFYIELISRPVARVDVDTVVKQKARKPTNILVTRDPGATVGWATLDQFFIT